MTKTYKAEHSTAEKTSKNDEDDLMKNTTP